MKRRAFLTAFWIAPVGAQTVDQAVAVVNQPTLATCPVCGTVSGLPGLPLVVGNIDGSFSSVVVTNALVIVCSKCSNLYCIPNVVAAQ